MSSTGAPVPNPNACGKSFHNAALLFENDELQERINKTLLFTYDIFDEDHYFEPANTVELFYRCFETTLVTSQIPVRGR